MDRDESLPGGFEEVEEEDEDDEEDEEEMLAAAKMQEQKDTFATFLHGKDGRAPAELPGSFNAMAAGAEVDETVADDPARLVLAPATHATLDPHTKSLHAYQERADGSTSGEHGNSGKYFADAAAATGVALVCMALAALVAILFVP